MSRFILRLALFALLFLLVGEVWFRTVVPAAHLPYMVQDTEDMVLHLTGSPSDVGHHSIGRLARQRTRWRVNGAGWNSSVEYLPAAQRTRPCVAVIGSSFVQGFHTDVDSGLTANLARELEPAHDVYNFGHAAVVAPQMVRVASYANRHFEPQVYVFVLHHDCLRESIRDLHGVAYNRQYRWEDGALVDVPAERYQPNPLRWLRAYSALGRYLYNNAGGIFGLRVVRQEAAPRHDAPDTTRAHREQPLLALAARRIVAEARASLPGAQILFVLDADRQRMYEQETRPQPLSESALLATACREHDCGYLDLTAAFWAAYAADGRRFEPDGNYHWNSHGAAVVARAIAGWLVLPPHRVREVPAAVEGEAEPAGTIAVAVGQRLAAEGIVFGVGGEQEQAGHLAEMTDDHEASIVDAQGGDVHPHHLAAPIGPSSSPSMTTACWPPRPAGNPRRHRSRTTSRWATTTATAGKTSPSPSGPTSTATSGPTWWWATRASPA